MQLPSDALEAINQMLEYVRSAAIRKACVLAKGIFVGHGRAEDWRLLASFLERQLQCKMIELNSDPTVGIYN